MLDVIIVGVWALIAGLWIGHMIGKREARSELTNAIASETILRTATSEVEKSRKYVGTGPDWQVSYRADIRVDGKPYLMVLERADATPTR